jgi:hypothetical protein
MPPCKISHFSIIPKYFFQLLFLSASEIKRKKNLKSGKGSRVVFSVSAQHRVDPQPNSTREAGTHSFLPRVTTKLAPVSHGPHTSASPSRAAAITHPTRYRACYRSKPIPFLCSLPRCPPVKFLPRPVPRCSIQASVSCPSHPLACRLACGPLASRIATEASRRPAAQANRCHCRCTAAMPVLSTR